MTNRISGQVRRLPCPKDKQGALRLYRLMQSRGWSEYRLHQQSGVAYNTIRAILDEQRRPTLDVQRRLTEALEVKPWEIWDNEPGQARRRAA